MNDKYITDEDMDQLQGMDAMKLDYRLVADRAHAASLMQEAIKAVMTSEAVSSRARYFAWFILKPTLDREDPLPLWKDPKRKRGDKRHNLKYLMRHNAAMRARSYYLQRNEAGDKISMEAACQAVQNDLETEGDYVQVADAWKDASKGRKTAEIDQEIREGNANSERFSSYLRVRSKSEGIKD